VGKALRWSEAPVLIGVVHLPPLPGSVSYSGGRASNYLNEVVEFAIGEVRKLYEAGFDAVIIENYGDAPFYKDPPLPVKASLMAVVRDVVKSFRDVPIGISMLRHSPKDLVEIALLSGASFVRINALCSIRVSPEGLIGPGLTGALEAFRELGEDPSSLEVLSDVDVKHSLPLAPGYSPEWEVEECASRRGPLRLSGLIVSGERTGSPPEPGYAERIRELARSLGFKVLIGSGISVENVKLYRDFDGYIVGTSIKKEHRAGSPIDPQKARALVLSVKEGRRG
jgi:membrane complex biogenesis BtpA family protein